MKKLSPQVLLVNKQNTLKLAPNCEYFFSNTNKSQNRHWQNSNILGTIMGLCLLHYCIYLSLYIWKLRSSKKLQIILVPPVSLSIIGKIGTYNDFFSLVFVKTHESPIVLHRKSFCNIIYAMNSKWIQNKNENQLEIIKLHKITKEIWNKKHLFFFYLTS